MSIDAVAILRIPDLAVLYSPPGSAACTIEPRGDASLVRIAVEFSHLTGDEHALVLRGHFGEKLDAHDDPRGILFFPAVREPKGASYEEMVHDMAGDGVWGAAFEPVDVVTERALAWALSHEGLVSRMHAAMGEDATQLDRAIHMHLRSINSTGGRANDVERYRTTLARLVSAMGTEFAAEYRKSARRELDAVRAEWATRDRRREQFDARFGERIAKGEPLIAREEMTAFLSRGGARIVLQSLTPTDRDEAARQAEQDLAKAGIDVDSLPDDDMAKWIFKELLAAKKDGA